MMFKQHFYQACEMIPSSLFPFFSSFVPAPHHFFSSCSSDLLSFAVGSVFLSPPPILTSQWDLSAGVEAAGDHITSASVSERDQCWECTHCREQPALLLQHRQLDKTVPYYKPKGSYSQQPKSTGML